MPRVQISARGPAVLRFLVVFVRYLVKVRDNWATTASFRVLYNSLFIDHSVA